MINKAILVGNAGADPELHYTTKGSAVANLNLATEETWTKDGVKESKTEWHRIVAFQRLAEIMGEYVTKGARLYIEGKIQTREWTDKEGIKRFSTEIVAREMKILTPKTSSAKKQAPNYTDPDGKPESTTGDGVPF